MFEEGPEGFKGGMSAGKYATITGASPATTTRDLSDLVEGVTDTPKVNSGTHDTCSRFRCGRLPMSR